MKEIKLTIESINAFLQKKAEAGNKPETIAEYRRLLLALRKWMLPNTTLHKETLQQWKAHMQSEGNLAIRTINRRLAVINQFLGFAGERNWQVSCIRLEDGEKSVLSLSLIHIFIFADQTTLKPHSEGIVKLEIPVNTYKIKVRNLYADMDF